MNFSFRPLQIVAALSSLILSGCHKTSTTSNGTIEYSKNANTSNEVVLYCSVDEEYARPIINQLQRETGLRIRPLFDVEAAKTAGLATRLRAEKSRPRADVFWSSATLQTLLLARDGVLEKVSSGQDVAPFKIGDGFWAATGQRARMLVYNASVKNPPRSLEDLLSPRFGGKIGVSNPQFGSAGDWVSALATRWGKAKTLAYFQQLKAKGAQAVAGNSVVAERVARGELLAGVTDSDDFLAMHKQNPNLRASVSLDATGQSEAVVVPMTVAIVQGAPHDEAAHRFADALLQSSTQSLIESEMPGVYSLQSQAAPGDNEQSVAIRNYAKNVIRRAPNDTTKWAASWDTIRDPLADILLRN